jgi:uncharacterized protein YkwD
MMIRLIAFLSLCVAASNGFAYVPGAVSAPMASENKEGEILVWRGERWMLDMVNWHRARAGMKPVKIDATVQARCRAHCYWMARTGSMTHSGRGGENIAAGQASVADAVQAWVNDPPHAVQIFDPNKTVIGVACYKSPNGGKFYCMEAH